MEQNDEREDIITLRTKNGEEIEFLEIAGISYEGKFYEILQPVELFDEMEDDEALVFAVTEKEDGTSALEVVTDDAVIDAVFAEYNRILDEEEE